MKQVERLRRSRFSSFQESFDFTMGDMSQEIRGVIDLSKKDFRHLKGLRDKIAHGSAAKMKGGLALTHVFQLVSKVSVLLLYWAYRDLGFSDDDFIVFVGNGLHPMVRNARLNQRKLDEALGNVCDLPTNTADFAEAKKGGSRDVVLEYRAGSGNYHLRSDISRLTNKWHTAEPRQYRSIEAFVASQVDSSKIKNVAYLTWAYLQCNEEFFKVWGLCVLNHPEGTDVPYRITRHDEKSGGWLPTENLK
jgi:hypothetical protein